MTRSSIKDDELVAQGEEHNDDMDVTIRWRAAKHVLEFRARQGVRQDDGSILYAHYPVAVTEFTSDFDIGERFVDGDVKWDGCSHLNFGEGEENPGYMHLCGGRDFETLIWTLRRVTDLAVAHVGVDRCAHFPLKP